MFIKNKKVTHDYFVIKTFEAGLVLHGAEVKSIRMNGCSLKESHVNNYQNELFLQNIHIQQYKFANTNEEKNRSIKLLMKKKEITKIAGIIKKEGLTMVPLSMYTKRSFIKIELALVKGKKQYDKRRAEKEKEWNKEKQTLRNIS